MTHTGRSIEKDTLATGESQFCHGFGLRNESQGIHVEQFKRAVIYDHLVPSHGIQCNTSQVQLVFVVTWRLARRQHPATMCCCTVSGPDDLVQQGLGKLLCLITWWHSDFNAKFVFPRVIIAFQQHYVPDISQAHIDLDNHRDKLIQLCQHALPCAMQRVGSDMHGRQQPP